MKVQNEIYCPFTQKIEYYVSQEHLAGMQAVDLCPVPLSSKVRSFIMFFQVKIH